MDKSHRNRKINLLQRGDLLMHLDKQHGPVVYEFLEPQSFTRGKPHRFLVRDLFLITKCGSRCLDRWMMQGNEVIFITEDSKEFRAIKVLYGKKD